MRTTVLLLMVPILFALGACAGPAPVYPRYQPMAEDGSGASLLDKNSFGTAPQHGYSDYQIDERTYLVTYQGFNPAGGPWSWRYLSHEEWIEIAHDYVLYRSAELARSKGAKQFVVLHRDDSNLAWRVLRAGRDKNGYYNVLEVIMGFKPGAHVLIRLLPNDEAVNLRSGNHVHEVDRLITRLMKNNAELVKQQGLGASPHIETDDDRRFIRWRAPVLIENTGLEPSLAMRQSLLNARQAAYFERLDADITEESHGIFGVVLWSRLPLSPIDMLRQGVKLGDQEGYAVFKLEEWTTEEYRPGRYWDDWNDSNAWFRTKARLVLQHQKDADSLDSVLVVDEIRENVMRKR